MLGTKYSEAMNATFIDSDGKEKPYIMGCYGIGIGRTVAAAIEQNHDENGMIFPKALAPFQVSVLPLKIKDEEIMSAAEKIYRELIGKGIRSHNRRQGRRARIQIQGRRAHRHTDTRSRGAEDYQGRGGGIETPEGRYFKERKTRRSGERSRVAPLIDI